jgi:DNA-binding NarL/FixJ family response regulator
MGYLLKSMPPREIVDRDSSGRFGKTIPAPCGSLEPRATLGEEPRQRARFEVLRELAGGGGNREIAKNLVHLEETVKVTFGTSWRSWAQAIAPRR